MTVKGIFSTHAFTFVKQQLRNKFQKMFQHSEPSLSTGISRTAFTQTAVLKTRLHSSRMRTTRSLTVSPSMLCSGGVVSQHALRQTPLLTVSHMPVKTLPCPNFVAGGNKPSKPFQQSRSTVMVKS